MTRLERFWRTVTVAAVLAVPSTGALAQPGRATLVGLVRDGDGRPIPAVEVRLKGTSLSARTDDSGGFRLSSVPAGQNAFEARRLGFEPATFQITSLADRTDSMVIALTGLAASLPGVLVRDEQSLRSQRLLAGFWDRRSRGFGTYFTRDDILRREPNNLVEMFRSTPAVRIVTQNGRPSLRMSRSMREKADCPPQYFVDNVRIENGQADEFPPGDVEGIEVYTGPATIPPQFAPRFNSFTCGVIVIWTRIPG
ncbi:MAG: carboxypeptidase regulatory-like domain-containing protein [Gemmatimonadaceae bacterium]|nr:carboxypeptidase regulatory-like domain-containing protein [Gemmatimonadaceae bacterium]